jgi:hypothetical protein
MAEWKKLVVSGSNISQLNNDAGYLTAGTITQANGFATASFLGTNILADSTTGSLNFASSSGQGLTISADAGTDTLTFGLSAIPNNSLANDSITIGDTSIDLGATATTINALTLTNAVGSGSFSGSFQGDGSGLTGIVATATSLQNALSSGTGIVPFVYNALVPIDVAVSGAAELSNNIITKWNDTDGKFVDSSLTDNGTAITGTTSIQLTGANSILSGSFSGSFQGNGSGLTGIASNLAISGSTGNGSVALQTQALSIIGTANEVETSVSGQTVTVGLPNDVTIGNNLTVTGDLTVNGTTTTINTDNLLVEDKFVLLASGSTSATDGGIIIQSAANGSGFAFLYDAGQARWGYTGSLAYNATSAAPDAFAAMVLDLQNGSTDIAAYQKNGNIKIDSGDIFIYA